MVETYLYAIGSVILVSLASLLGASFLAIRDARLKPLIFFLVSLSVGALFGDAFLHLVPEAFEEAGSSLLVSLAILSGIVLFFILEKFVHWHHYHEEDEVEHSLHSGGAGSRLSVMVLIGDALHNFIDGIVIGVSFLVSPAVGVATTLAVLVHEIPQEIGDFALLVHSGMSKRRALFANFASALISVLGVLLALWVGESVASALPLLLAVAAGGFVYIAGSDLVPELHKTTSTGKSLIQLVAILVGIALMAGLLFLE